MNEVKLSLSLLAALAGVLGAAARDLQSEIDALAAAGGGTLTLTAGVYRSGALFFRPGVALHLEKGAVLEGVDEAAAYPLCETRIEGETCRYYPALVNAEGCDGFTISGEGVIDGHGANTWEAFWRERAAARKEGREFRNKSLMRPRLLYVSNSKNVEVSGVTFRNSKFWTTHYYNCENVTVRDCRIVAEILADKDGKELKGPSTDAIDIDKCRHFKVLNCDIAVNDDGVAVKGGKGAWADDYVKHPENGPSSDVLVEGCAFRYPTHSALTLGSECPEAEDITMRNCTVDGVGNLLCLKMRTDTPQHYANVLVENVSGRVNTLLNTSAWSQYADLGGRTKAAVMSHAKNVTLRNLRVDCRARHVKKGEGEYFDLENVVVEPAAPLPALPPAAERDKAGAAAPSLTWSKPLEIGNYDVTIRLGDAERPTVNFVKFMGRRLAGDRIETKAGEFRDFTFTARVPGPFTKKDNGENRALDLSLFTNGAQVAVPEPKVTRNDAAPTIWLCGDSTVTDQKAEPWGSWGQILPAFVKPGWACVNFARSGLAMATFESEGRLGRILGGLKPGDWVIVQFGHNDQKRKGEEPENGYTRRYGEWLKAFAAKRAHLVVVSPCERRRFDEKTGEHQPKTLADYANAARAFAEKNHLPFIDLNDITYRLHDKLGAEGTKPLQVNNRGKLDNTHHTTYGAYVNARIIAAQLAAFDGIGAAIRDEDRAYDAMNPVDPKIPASGKTSWKKPEGS